MNSFLDNNTDGGKTFLLYGKLNDWFCPGTMEILDIDELLLRLLKSRGYQHVVFYGGAGNRGKHCYDEESARFFIVQPSGPSEQPSAPQTQPTNPQPQTPSGSSPSELMERRFGRRHRRPSGNTRRAGASTENTEEVQASPTPAPEQATPQTPPAQVRYSQIDISNGEFIQEITRLASQNEKFAVVFYNIFDFLSAPDHTDRKLLDQIVSIMDKPFSNVLCIFEAPSDPDVRQLCNGLRSSQLGVKFLRYNTPTDPTLNRYNCFHIGAPREDEVQNLLGRLEMIGHHGRNLDYDKSKARELAHELLGEISRNSQDEPSLLRIQICLENWMDQPGQPQKPLLDKQAIAEIFGIQARDDTPALERLRRVQGWEKVYELINGVLVLKRRQVQQQNQILEDESNTEENDICIQRLAGIRTVRRKRQVPVPNFVLKGNPGTGKTEIGHMIGDILYEAGILPTSKVVTVGKSELTSSLVAGIPRAVIECADRAEGGVLFIDEAPQLADKDGGLNNEGSGPEVIQTLNRVMTDPTRQLCVVLSGYTDKMEELFKIDPGFRSRFGGNEVIIDDYEPPLLNKILRSRLRCLNDLTFTLSPDVYDESREGSEKQPLDHYLEHLYLKRDRRTFGNARDMVTLAQRLASTALAEDRMVIEQKDFYGFAPFSEQAADAEPDIVDETWFEPVNPTDSMEELERYIRENTVGLEPLIERFRMIYERVMETRGLGLPVDKLGLRSFVLVGNPGTGKDLVANLLGRLLRILNVLNCPEIIVHDGGDLASSMSGGSVITAKEWVKKAQERNALLFINEAHQLTNTHFDGKGALRAFIAPMTNKSQFISAFAVYNNELENFYKLDSGLSSRVEEIHLPEYTDLQLYEIFKCMCRKRQIPVDHERMEPVLHLISRICVRLYRERQDNSGNARQMEVLLGEMNDRRSARCRLAHIPYDDPERWIFQPEDIPDSWLVNLPDRSCLDAPTRDDFSEIERILSQEVVGREYLVNIFRELADEANEARAQGDKSFYPDPLILVGNPGSGKTLIGRLLAKLYNVIGVVQSVDPVFFDGSTITSTYVNGVRKAAEEQIELARNRHAMIFLDEAHQLLDQHDGKGAIQAFLSPLNDPNPQNRVLTCFAVYESRLEEFLAVDDGLNRRVKIIKLEDYTGPQLKEIFLHMAAKKNTISEELLAALDQVCDTLAARATVRSGNAGMVQNLLKQLNNNRRTRCRNNGSAYDDPNRMTLLLEDLPDDLRP